MSKSKSQSKYIAVGAGIAIVIAVVILSSNMVHSNTDLKTASPDATVEGLQVGNIAPAFSLTDPQKEMITKKSLEGKPQLLT